MTTEVTKHHDTIVGPTYDLQRHKLIEATIATDENGDGSITIDFQTDGQQFDDDIRREPFSEAPWVVLDDGVSSPAATLKNITADSLDVEVSGSSTTNGSVTVRLQARGPK